MIDRFTTSSPGRAGTSRRDLLKSALTGALTLGGLALLPKGSLAQGVKPGRGASRAYPWFRLRAQPGQVQIFPGPLTDVNTFTGTLIRGAAGSMQPIPGSYLGPTLHVWQGQRVRIDFENGLIDMSILHQHGLEVAEDVDGHPRFAIMPNESLTHEFVVLNRAGTYWYHPHGHGNTAPQVYSGLAGFLIVHDAEDAALPLPRGAFDVPLCIQDRRFDAGNQLIYNPGGMAGSLGNRVLVNGFPDFRLDVATRVYRLRLLNGSNSRTYKLAWSDGRPLIAIGTDGGLLPAPVSKNYIMLAPAERVDLWADFSLMKVGQVLQLLSLAFDAPGPSGGQFPPNGEPMEVLTVRVTRSETESLTLPATLTPIARHSIQEAVNGNNPRQFVLGLGTINGRTFEITSVAPDEIVRLGDLECWEFANTDSTIRMIHPMHVHSVQFQIYDRTIEPAYAASYQTIQQGFVDDGWKDTVLVYPGERVKVLLKFERHTGLFLNHCHLLEHEDMDMMRNYRVDFPSSDDARDGKR